VAGVRTSAVSMTDPTTNYADVIRRRQGEWRIMGNVQVDADAGASLVP
jgi:hypothetical protein